MRYPDRGVIDVYTALSLPCPSSKLTGVWTIVVHVFWKYIWILLSVYFSVGYILCFMMLFQNSNKHRQIQLSQSRKAVSVSKYSTEHKLFEKLTATEPQPHRTVLKIMRY